MSGIRDTEVHLATISQITIVFLHAEVTGLEHVQVLSDELSRERITRFRNAITRSSVWQLWQL